MSIKDQILESYEKESLTAIDNQFKLKDIENVKDLPDEMAKYMYRNVDTFRSQGFQELEAYVGREVVISFGGY